MINDSEIFEKFEDKIKSSRLSIYYNNYNFNYDEIIEKLDILYSGIKHVMESILSSNLKSIVSFFNNNIDFYLRYFTFDNFKLLTKNSHLNSNNRRKVTIIVNFSFAFIMNEDHYVNNDLFNDKFECYRGQSNTTWGLVPSLFRDAKNFVKNDMELFTYDEILNVYKENGLTHKYNIVFNDDSPYHILSFFQHSCAFSPLIDFTKNEDVAKSFALANSSDYSSFKYIDSAVFKLSYKNFQIEDNIDVIDKFFREEYKVIYSKKNSFSLKELFDAAKMLKKTVKTMYDLINLFEPKFFIIDLVTNDRMKYQKGLFIVFYDCIIRGDKKIFYELNKDFDIDKTIIKTRDKLIEKDKIPPEYNIRFMLNPYEFFNP